MAEAWDVGAGGTPPTIAAAARNTAPAKPDSAGNQMCVRSTVTAAILRIVLRDGVTCSATPHRHAVRYCRTVRGLSKRCWNDAAPDECMAAFGCRFVEPAIRSTGVWRSGCGRPTVVVVPE